MSVDERTDKSSEEGSVGELNGAVLDDERGAQLCGLGCGLRCCDATQGFGREGGGEAVGRDTGGA